MYLVWVAGSEKDPRRHRSYGVAGFFGSLCLVVFIEMVMRVWSEVQRVASKSVCFMVLAVVLHCNVLALPIIWSVMVLFRQVGCWVSGVRPVRKNMFSSSHVSVRLSPDALLLLPPYCGAWMGANRECGRSTGRTWALKSPMSMILPLFNW